MPAISTLRLDKSSKNRTRKRFKPLAVQTSTVKKSAATISSQCCERNSFQVVLRALIHPTGNRHQQELKRIEHSRSLLPILSTLPSNHKLAVNSIGSNFRAIRDDGRSVSGLAG